MENKKTHKTANLLKGVILTGVIAGLTPLTANSSALFTYDVLGSGAEIRTHILEERTTTSSVYELKCGEEKTHKKKEKTTKNKKGKKTKKKKGKVKKEKTIEGTCGEGKCGVE